jgi:hypothetical protein
VRVRQGGDGSGGRGDRWRCGDPGSGWIPTGGRRACCSWRHDRGNDRTEAVRAGGDR